MVVELTKVHYFDVNETGRNFQISTISRPEPRQKRPNTVIKKNIFGHKWVLKINEGTNEEKLKRSRTRLVVYLVVFACIVVAVSFGILLTVETKFIKTGDESTKVAKIPKTNAIGPVYQDKVNPNLLSDSTDSYSKNNQNYEAAKNITVPIANHCDRCNRTQQICINTINDSSPKCAEIIDRKDPTGCGGLCRINKEYCKLLDPQDMLYQCRPLRNTLNCSSNAHSCGNMCIPSKMRCDGIFHCTDRSDEHNCSCNLTSHFQCGNSTGCLDQWKRCDGKVDCWDNSDEMNCSNTHACGAGEIPCRDGLRCIKAEHFCDGVFQCIDRSDEPKGCEIQK